MIDASTQRNFNVYGSGATISAQGVTLMAVPRRWSEPHAVHINMVAVNPTGKGNLQALPVGAGTGAGLSVNYNTIDTNLANAGTVKTVTGVGPDISVALIIRQPTRPSMSWDTIIQPPNISKIKGGDFYFSALYFSDR